VSAPPFHLDASLVRRIAEARRVVAMTGAGISAESGVPTFRDAQTGLWSRYSPEELATPEAFDRDPELVRSWYAWRRELVRSAAPNAGHAALADLARLVPLTLITQNVDGLHARAGSEPIEFHGNLLVDRCERDCGYEREATPASDSESGPRCLRCGARLRPGVVWFGEPIPPAALVRAEAAAAECDVFLSIGTSSLVYPAAGLAASARQSGAAIVEVNLAATPLSPHADHVLRGPAAAVLPALVDAVAAAQGTRRNS
jgi:NAD-dependent deacetylase